MSFCQSQKIHETFLLHYNFRCPSVLKSLFPLIGTMGKLEDLKFSGWMKQNHPCLSCVRIILDHSNNSLSYFIFLKFWKIKQSILMEYGHYALSKTKITICGTNGILFACLWILLKIPGFCTLMEKMPKTWPTSTISQENSMNDFLIKQIYRWW